MVGGFYNYGVRNGKKAGAMTGSGPINQKPQAIYSTPSLLLGGGQRLWRNGTKG